MKSMWKICVAFSAAVALATTFGCGGEKLPDGMPKLTPAALTFTVDGKGLADANITMIPDDGGRWTAVGKTDKSGVAEMKTDGKYKGAAPGSYKIIVSAPDEIDDGEYGPPPTDDPAALDAWNRKVEGVQFKRTAVVSQEFGDVEATPLTLTVADAKVAETFDLGASVREEVEVEEK